MVTFQTLTAIIMNKILISTAMLAWASIFSAAAQKSLRSESKAPSARPVTVEIDPQKKYQEIESIGGNYAQANYTKDAQDAVGVFALQHLQATHVRVPIPLKKWNRKMTMPALLISTGKNLPIRELLILSS